MYCSPLAPNSPTATPLAPSPAAIPLAPAKITISPSDWLLLLDWSLLVDEELSLLWLLLLLDSLDWLDALLWLDSELAELVEELELTLLVDEEDWSSQNKSNCKPAPEL